MPISSSTGNLSFIDYLPNCVAIIVSLVLGTDRWLPLARHTHRILLQASAYLAHTSTVSLPLLYTSRVPNHYRLPFVSDYQASEWYRTIRLTANLNECGEPGLGLGLGLGLECAGLPRAGLQRAGLERAGLGPGLERGGLELEPIYIMRTHRVPHT